MNAFQKHFVRATRVALLAAAGVALVLPAVTHEAAELWPADALGDYEVWEQPANVPTWAEHADEFPAGCEPWKGGKSPDLLAVVDVHSDAVVMGFDEAWKVTHDDERANDVWVVGTCR